MKGKTVIVTGANSGIGFETAATLAGRGASVTITSRDPAKGSAAVAAIRERHPGADVHLGMCDFASLDEVRSFAKDFMENHDALHVLVNNAGAMQSIRSETVDGHEMTFQVNHLAPFLLTTLLLPLIIDSAPARIVTLGSSGHRVGNIDFEDLLSEKSYKPLRVYGTSKLCNILFTRELARRLQGTGVTANCVNPGPVRTGFGQDGDTRGLFKLGLNIHRNIQRTPARGAEVVIHVATDPIGGEVSGEYWFNNRQSRTRKKGADMEVARRLWEVSEQLVS